MPTNATTILQQLCSLPTAPFAEQHVIRYVEDFVAARPRLRLERDPAGNLLIELPARRRSRSRPGHARWVFGAHIDHPGFIARQMLDARTLEADFRGWVAIDYVRGTKVRFFDGGREVPGTVVDATAEDHERLSVPRHVKVRLGSPVAPGCPGMFDQGEGRLRGGRFYCRGCDDVAGAAAALAMLDELMRKPPESPVAVLLTRAEEEGFIGALAAVLRPRLLRRSDRIVAIECSAVQPFAPQGKGAIIRIGDKTSVFNSGLSYFLAFQAEQLALRDKTFRYQRALMPGGTCEATVYDIYGYTAGSICVALGNYHNMDRDKQRIGPEYIHIGDWQNMLKLFLHVARTGHEYEPGHKPLKQRVEKRFEQLQHLL